MALHPQCKAFLDTLAAAGGKPLEQLPLSDARLVPRLLVEFGGAEEPVAHVENRAGVSVQLKRYDGMIHPFFNLGGVVDDARKAMADAAAAVRLATGAAAPAGI